MKRKVSLSKTVDVQTLEEKIPGDTSHLILNSNSRLQSLPTSLFCKLSDSLVVLSLKNNRLTSLPDEIGSMRSLQSLRLDGNLFTSLPDSICQLIGLEKLIVNNNFLTHLPDAIGDLINLRELNVANNRLGSLPLGLCNVKLKELVVHPNPYCISPPQSVLSSMSGIYKWLQATAEEEKFSAKFYYRGDRGKTAKWLADQAPKKAKEDAPSISNHPLLSPETEVFFMLHIGVAETANERKYMEDRHLVVHHVTPPESQEAVLSKKSVSEPSLEMPSTSSTAASEMSRKSWPAIAAVGIFDGHGGSQTVDYVTANVVQFVTSNKHFLEDEPPKLVTDERGIQFVGVNKAKKDTQRYVEQTPVPQLDDGLMRWAGRAVLEGFVELDKACLKNARMQGIFDGTTALLALLIQHPEGILLLIGNTGDSRIVLCRDGKALRLTKDHKPQDPVEKARVEALEGGYVSRASTGTMRVQGSLAVSRAFGDLDMKQPKPYVTAEPDVLAYTLTPNDSFFIIGSDGLWDAISDQRAVELVQRKAGSDANPKKAAESLMKEAMDEESRDNITVVVGFLRWGVRYPEHPSSSSSSFPNSDIIDGHDS